jgi:DNA gyrase/topoisomerase IV subunit B
VLKSPILIADISPTMKMECAFNFDAGGNSKINCFGNFCPTQSGTHLIGFVEGVSNWFRYYMNNIFLATGKTNTISNKKDNKKKNTLVIENIDIQSSLYGAIHAAHIEPIFTGQAKEILSNAEMKPYVKKTIELGLKDWAAKNPAELQKLCKFIKSMAEIRQAQDTSKIKLSTKYNSPLTGFPAKMTRPTGPKSQWEGIYFVEGDSAEGTAKVARIKSCQGILPLRGKIINAFTNSVEKVLSNSECQDIFNSIQGGYGKNFDISKVPWKFVASLTDADIDGAHIAVLFLVLMLVYCRPLVEEGMVYKAQPPLYGTKVKGKDVFFGSRIDFVKYVQKEFLNNNTILNYDGSPLSHIELLDVLIKNEDYTYELNKMSDSYAIDPYLLENLLINRAFSANQLKNELSRHERFRFVKDIKTINTGVYIDGLVNQKSQTIYLGDSLIQSASNILNFINNANSHYFILNGKMVSLYEVMNTYEKSKPKHVTRYKGLGEMKADQLRESTMDPDGPRCMIRYTANDIVKEVEELRNLRNNLNLLKQPDNVTRTDLLD